MVFISTFPDHLPTVIEEGRCPDASTTVDIVAAACLSPVIDGIVTYQRNPCEYVGLYFDLIVRNPIGTASVNLAKFCGIRPRMYIKDLF